MLVIWSNMECYKNYESPISGQVRLPVRFKRLYVGTSRFWMLDIKSFLRKKASQQWWLKGPFIPALLSVHGEWVTCIRHMSDILYAHSLYDNTHSNSCTTVGCLSTIRSLTSAYFSTNWAYFSNLDFTNQDKTTGPHFFLTPKACFSYLRACRSCH